MTRVSTHGTMKTILVTVTIALAGAASANAQIFRPSVGSGAVVGAIAGGLIGGHNGDRWAEGAVIGAAAGALIGAAMTPVEPAYQPPPVYQAPAYGQQVYGHSGYPTTQTVYAPAPIANAPTIPDAPRVSDQPAPQVVYAPPQVVYVERQPEVVYVPAPPVYVRPPVVSFGIYAGPRYVAPVRHMHVPRYVPAPRYGHGHGHGSHSYGRPSSGHHGSRGSGRW